MQAPFCTKPGCFPSVSHLNSPGTPPFLFFPGSSARRKSHQYRPKPESQVDEYVGAFELHALCPLGVLLSCLHFQISEFAGAFVLDNRFYSLAPAAMPIPELPPVITYTLSEQSPLGIHSADTM